MNHFAKAGDKLTALGTYLAGVVALLDQGSKAWLLDFVMKPPRVVPVTSWFNLVLSWNKGVTFGLFNHVPAWEAWQSYILIAIALVILALLFRWLTQCETLWAALGLGFVMGGAVGNVIDRVRFGAVTDFLDFHIDGWHWYAFNLADSAIVCGICFLALDHLVMARKKG